MDSFIEDVLRYYGRAGEQVEAVTLVMDFVPTGTPAGRPPAKLAVTIRRDHDVPGYIARANVGLAFGHGRSLGGAFRDCLDDFNDRLGAFREERGRLGPGPQAELAEYDRWLSVPP